MDINWEFQQENAAQQLKIIALEKVLMYYGDIENYKLSGFRGARRLAKIESDAGAMARKTLEELKNGSS